MVKYRSTKLRKRRKREFWIKLSLVIVVLLCFVFSISKISEINRINISQFKISGNEVVTSELIKKTTSDILSNKYLKLFSKSNFLIYPKDKIEETLLETFPRLNKVDLDIDSFNILKISIEERDPYALLCKKGLFKEDKKYLNQTNAETFDKENEEEKTPKELKERCLFLDNAGFVFGKAPNFSKEVFFKYYVGLADISLIGKYAFEIEKFKEIDSFIQFIDGLGLNPYKLETDGIKNYEIFFGENSRLIFEVDQDIKEVTTNLQSVLNMDEFADEGFIGHIDYIDLRFGNKVFYKIK